jgi:lipopolysaccharide biosynthesis protein
VKYKLIFNYIKSRIQELQFVTFRFWFWVLTRGNWKKTVLYEEGIECNGKKICLFAHFDTDAIVQDFVVFYLQALKAQGIEVIFITTSEQMKPEELRKLKEFTCKRIVRRNIGYDFGSWKTGFQYVNDYKNSELILLANDSVVGPINPLDKMFKSMSCAGYDIWGVTDNYEVNYHVQSYFLCFTGRALQNGFIEEYMDQITVESCKQDIINKYEVGLIQRAINLGYRVGAYCMYDQIEVGLLQSQHELSYLCESIRVNSTLWFIDELINKHEIPFVKRELLIHNPHDIDLNGVIYFIKYRSDFPFKNISKYLK